VDPCTAALSVKDQKHHRDGCAVAGRTGAGSSWDADSWRSSSPGSEQQHQRLMAKPAAELSVAEHAWGLGPEQVWLPTAPTPCETWDPSFCAVGGQGEMASNCSCHPQLLEDSLMLRTCSTVAVLPPVVDDFSFPK